MTFFLILYIYVIEFLDFSPLAAAEKKEKVCVCVFLYSGSLRENIDSFFCLFQPGKEKKHPA